MPLSGSALSADIHAALAGVPWNGTQLSVFCNALGGGIVQATSGILMFTTTDTGLTPGSGSGMGTGITGMSESGISSLIFSTGQGFWSGSQNNGPGTQWNTFCQKVAKAVNDHFKANALLTSTHSPVYLGTGQVLVYSGVTMSAMKSAIVGLAPGSWASKRFPELAEAVATGVVTQITSHTPADVVTITGAPAGPPVPGAGSGSGIVT